LYDTPMWCDSPLQKVSDTGCNGVSARAVVAVAVVELFVMLA
jgi:hypothetical protein